MKINKLAFANLKNITACIDLAPVTIVSGPNGSGKTAVMDAVTLALLGHIPRLGKTTAATARLASKMPLEIEAYTDAGAIKFALNGKGSGIKTTRTGEPPKMPEILFDRSLWLAASGPGKERLIRENVAAIEEQAEAIWTKLLADTGRTPSTKDGSVETRIDALLRDLSNEASALNDLQKRWKQTILGLESLDMMKAQAPTTAPDPAELKGMRERLTAYREAIARNNAELTALNKEIAATVEAKSRIGAAIAAVPAEPTIGKEAAERLIDRLLTERDELQRRAASADASAKHAAANQKRLDTINAKIAELELRLAKLRTDAGGAPSSELIESAHDAMTPEEFAEFNAAYVAAQEKAEKLTLSAQKLASDLWDAEEHATVCQHCGSHADHWAKSPIKALREKSDAEARDALAAKAEADKFKAKYVDVIRRMEDRKILNAYQRLTEEISLAEKQLQELQAERDTITVEVVEDTMKLHGRIADIEADVEDLRAVIQIHLDRLALPKLQAELDALPSVADLELQSKGFVTMIADITGNADAITHDIEHAENEARLYAEVQAKETQLKDATAELDKVEADKKALSEVTTAVKAAAKTVSGLSIQAILNVANDFLNGVFDWKLTSNDGELGRWNGLIWIPLEAFSGAEQTVILAAIQAALAANAEFKLLMIDELATIDASRAAIFYANIHKAVEAGILDQAILLDIRTPAVDFPHAAITFAAS